MSAIPIVRDVLLILAAVGVALWFGQAWIEKNLIEKSQIVQALNDARAKLTACEAKK